MLRTNLPRAIRHLRRRRGWRQTDLAVHAGTSRQIVSRVECGYLASVPLSTLERMAGALGATTDLTVRWQGEQLDRLMDAAHARIQEQAVAFLRGCGWIANVEVSFNHYGDRGRVDVLAYHLAAGAVLVCEVKSAIGDVQETLGRIDIKTRLGRVLANEAGWRDVRSVVPALVIGRSRTAQRVVATHASLFLRFERRGRAAAAWLRHPGEPVPSGVLWLVDAPDAPGMSTTRVRRAGRRPSVR